MRCSSCASENPDVSKFCIECAAPLSRRCTSCGVENLPQAKFCAQCGKPLTAQAGPKATERVAVPPDAEREAERRQLTVMFCDLVGAPIAHEDHAQRACYAALSLRDAVREYANEVRAQHGMPFGVRIGLNSGEVVVGKISDDLRMDYTARGHTASIGARMEQMA